MFYFYFGVANFTKLNYQKKNLIYFNNYFVSQNATTIFITNFEIHDILGNIFNLPKKIVLNLIFCLKNI